MGTKSSTAASNLFEVDEDSEKLSPRKAEAFHSLVAKILFVTKRSRPDTGLSVLFLTTRVRDPSNQDWKKLVHLFKYLSGTQDIPLILRADGSGILKWYVDASRECTQTWGVKPEGVWQWKRDSQYQLQRNRSWTLEAPQIRKSWELMVACQECCVPGCFWKRKTMELNKILCSKTTKLPCC